MRRAALMIIGLALAGCGGGDRDQADAPPTTVTSPAGSQLDAAAGGTTVPGSVPAGGAPDSTSTSSPAAGAPGSPGGSAAAIGGSGVATGGGTSTGGGAEATGGTGGSGGSTGAGSGSSETPTTAGGTEAPSSGGSGSPPPTIYATAEECAALRQVLAVVDHPELRQLAVQANCI